MIPIRLEKQKNIRDLGDTVTLDGRVIRRNKLIRSGRLSELSDADIMYLLGICRVRTVVDLRSAKESDERPDPPWGVAAYSRISLLSDDQMGFGSFAGSPQIKISVLDALINMTSGPVYTPQQYLQDIYRKFITSKQAQNATRRFFELLLSMKGGALLYHCNGGKDRTGIITAFLLTALNVSWDIIADGPGGNVQSGRYASGIFETGDRDHRRNPGGIAKPPIAIRIMDFSSSQHKNVTIHCYNKTVKNQQSMHCCNDTGKCGTGVWSAC